MAEILFITRDDIVRYTALNGNVDTDKFIQFIKIAQDVQIENYLGTKLVDKLKQLIEDNEVNDAGNENYKFLLAIPKIITVFEDLILKDGLKPTAKLSFGMMLLT